MISWMQKHKKYLIITIWISVITFVGAGFVGWGSYVYGSKSRAIAKVGDVDITLLEFRLTYGNLYSYYSKMFGGNFDENMAKQLRLQETAFNILKREALLVNLAKSYNLRVLDREIAENIYQNRDFYQDGNFSRERYELILANSGLSPKEYEERLYKTILISKLMKLLHISTTPFEEELFSSLLKLKDKLEIKYLYTSDITDVNVSEEEIRKYWEANKERYLTEQLYTILYIETPLIDKVYSEKEIEDYYNSHALEYGDKLENVKSLVIEDMLKKESKKSAMKDYLKFKKGTYQGVVKEATVGEINSLLSIEDMKELENSKAGEVLKPKYSNGKYITAKLVSIQPPQIRPFEDVKDEVRDELVQKKKEEKLIELAKQQYTNFKGEITTYIGINDTQLLPELFPQEATQLLATIFTQSSDRGFVKLGNKVVLYRVVEQKIDEEIGDVDIQQMAKQLKENILDSNLIKKLEYHYSIETYFKG